MALARAAVQADTNNQAICQPESLAAKPSAIHAAADKHAKKIAVAVRYAFASGRAVVNRTTLAQARTAKQATAALAPAADAVSSALLEVLPSVLHAALVAGGEVGAAGLARQRLKAAELSTLAAFSFNPEHKNLDKWLASRVETLATQLSETTAKNIASVIARTFDESGLKTMAKWEDDLLQSIGSVERALSIAQTECLLGETVVDSAVVRAIHRRMYVGDIFEITTCGGRQFTATTNHPMLTSRGWVSAYEIQEGDSLICNTREQNHVSGHDPDIKNIPPTIIEIFNTALLYGSFERRPQTNKDFHGDGIDGEVDIACPFWQLSVGNFIPLYEPLIKQILPKSYTPSLRFCNTCGALLLINKSLCFCSRSDVDSITNQIAFDGAGVNTINFCDIFSVHAREVKFSNILGWQVINGLHVPAFCEERQPESVGSISHYSSFDNNESSKPQANPRFTSDLFECQAGKVELDNVLSIRVRKFSGHVYNLTTTHGYFTINGGIYTGNSMTAVNSGQRAAWNQAAEERLLRDPRRVWVAYPDACDLCDELNGERTDRDGIYPGDGGDGPPLHPACRCIEELG